MNAFAWRGDLGVASMTVLQTTVDDEIGAKAERVFERSGLTTSQAMRIMITQVANDGCSPFDGLFSSRSDVKMNDALKRDIIYAEAQEYGLIPDDSVEDPTRIPVDVLSELGISPSEVGQ